MMEIPSWLRGHSDFPFIWTCWVDSKPYPLRNTAGADVGDCAGFPSQDYPFKSPMEMEI